MAERNLTSGGRHAQLTSAEGRGEPDRTALERYVSAQHKAGAAEALGYGAGGAGS